MANDVDLTRSPPTGQVLSNGTVDESIKVPRLGKVSFEDYHAMWSGMATTKPMANVRSPLHAVLSADSNLRAAHFGLPQQELREEVNKQLEEHNAIMYGKFEKSGQNIAELKSNKMQLLRRVYLPKQQEGEICLQLSCLFLNYQPPPPPSVIISVDILITVSSRYAVDDLTSSSGQDEDMLGSIGTGELSCMRTNGS